MILHIFCISESPVEETIETRHLGKRWAALDEIGPVHADSWLCVMCTEKKIISFPGIAASISP
jgi:hypothetical protein